LREKSKEEAIQQEAEELARQVERMIVVASWP
jgi:hypothetical protein